MRHIYLNWVEREDYAQPEEQLQLFTVKYGRTLGGAITITINYLT